jgi:thiol-disulfide isomerase/thioredoxin
LSRRKRHGRKKRGQSRDKKNNPSQTSKDNSNSKHQKRSISHEQQFLDDFKARQRKRDIIFVVFIVIFLIAGYTGYYLYDTYYDGDKTDNSKPNIIPNNNNQDNNINNDNPTDEPEIVWETYDAGTTKAENNNKPVLIDFYADWCGPCKSMDKQLYTDSRVITKSDNFVCIKVNGDYNPDLMTQYGVSSYPTIVFLDSNQDEVTRWVGWGYDVENQIVEFLGYMDETLKH